MQEIVVLSIAATALIYLGYKFIIKKSAHDCDKCGANGKESVKN